MKNTFAKRLKLAIEKRNISQAEAARKCGISQQSINYIINNNLKSSKLAAQIASALCINPEWLISGRGKFEESKVYEIPIIHSVNMLNKFIQKKIDLNSLSYTVIDRYLSDLVFAYLIKPKKMLICYDETAIADIVASQYLTVENDTVSITDQKYDFSFPIFEWRLRNEDF